MHYCVQRSSCERRGRAAQPSSSMWAEGAAAQGDPRPMVHPETFAAGMEVGEGEKEVPVKVVVPAIQYSIPSTDPADYRTVTQRWLMQRL